MAPRGNLALVGRSEDGWGVPPLATNQGSEFGWFDRLFFGWQEGKVFDYSDWEARDLSEMLSKDYKARQIENVQARPISSATRTLSASKGDKGEHELIAGLFEADPLNGGCQTSLDLIVDQMTSAFSFKKAYWEIEWARGEGDFQGKIIPNKVEWRPQTTCRLLRDPKTSKMLGFQQESYYSGPGMVSNLYPITVPPEKAMVYIHGARRDPINGISDMEIPYWAWKTKQKILFLWFQFLEGVSLPRVIVKAPDDRASDIAGKLQRVKSSGVLPVNTDDPSKVDISQLDLAGHGADQFMAAIRWLDGCATGSALAGFLDLTGNATSGNGPVGVHLSKDASDFFLQTLEAKTREMSFAVRSELFAPICRYNFGPSAKIPEYKFEPLNAEDKSDAVTMLSNLMRSRDPALIPDDFIGQLAAVVADYIGLNGAEVEKSFKKAAAEAKAKAAEQAKMMATQMGQQVAGAAGAVGAASKMVAQAQTPTGPAPKGPTPSKQFPGMGGAAQLPRFY